MATLHERIDAEWENIDKVMRSLPDVGHLDSLSTLELAGIGSLIHSFYNGIENILKQCLLSSSCSLPQGPAWHQDLLKQAEIQAVISKTISKKLQPYLAFRHFFSHSYSFEIRAERIRPLMNDLSGIAVEFHNEIMSFIKQD